MNKHILLVLLTLHCSSTYTQDKEIQWTVVGAGGAGIAAVGTLLDSGISKEDLIWIDPDFDVGRLGKYYHNVPGNSVASTYHYFVQQCSSFKEVTTPAMEQLLATDPDSEPLLKAIIEPLQDITHHLIHTKQVHIIKDHITTLESLENKMWHLILNNGTELVSHNVVLATGCHPRQLDYPVQDIISLDKALDQPTLATLVDPDDTVAVIGSAHSAVLIMKFLHEIGVKQIVNFYLYPFKYKYNMGENNPTTKAGLAGIAARWAYEVLEHNRPDNIVRVENTKDEREQWLPACNKLIYAIGYERNEVCDLTIHTLGYDEETGVIAPHLFGLGIAFPEKVKDYDGSTKVCAIGLVDFMKYAQRVVPQWIAELDLGTPHKQVDRFLIESL